MHNLKTVFSLDNLQSSTSLKAYAGAIVAIILLFYPPSNPLSPDQVNHLTEQAQLLIGLMFAAVAGLSKILAFYHGFIAFVNFLYNERKGITIVPDSTTAHLAVNVEKAHEL